MTDSWTITEQSQTGDIQYVIAEYDQQIGVGVTTISLNVAGYTSGTVAAIGSSTSAELLLEGSNDGISWFGLALRKVLNATSPLINFITWGRAVREIRLTGAVATVNTGDPLLIIAIAGGSGILDSTAGSTYAPGSNKEIIFNDNGAFAGTVGALYDNSANSGDGQIQLTAGSASEPTLSFADNDNTYNTGIYKDDVDRLGLSCGHPGTVGTPIAVFTNTTSGAYSPGLNIPNASDPEELGIRRLATSTGGTAGDATWEDGFFGNSETMYFVCNDFSYVNTAGNTAQTCGVNINRYPGVCLPLTVGGILSAVRLIPKGFYIRNDTPLTIQILSSTTSLFQNLACTAQVFSYNITTPTVPPVAISAAQTLNTWAPGTGTNIQTIITANVEGDGNTVILVKIIIPVGVPVNVADNLNGGLSWASLSLSRLPIP